MFLDQKKLLLALSAQLLALGLLGCSNQYREVNFSPESSEVTSMFDAIETEGLSDSAWQSALDLKNDPYSTIYFASAPGQLGPVVSVLSVIDFSFMGSEFANLFHEDIEFADIAFVDLPTEQGHQAALVIRIKLFASANIVTRTFASTTPGSVQGGEFAVTVENNGVQLVLYSYDVNKDGSLKGIIQLRVNDFDQFGNEQNNGKFSTLVGFGG